MRPTAGRPRRRVAAPNDRMLSLTEAAELLRLSRRETRHYVERGELPGKRIRARWKFRRQDIEAFRTKSGWDFGNQET